MRNNIEECEQIRSSDRAERCLASPAYKPLSQREIVLLVKLERLGCSKPDLWRPLCNKTKMSSMTRSHDTCNACSVQGQRASTEGSSTSSFALHESIVSIAANGGDSPIFTKECRLPISHAVASIVHCRPARELCCPYNYRWLSCHS